MDPRRRPSWFPGCLAALLLAGCGGRVTDDAFAAGTGGAGGTIANGTAGTAGIVAPAGSGGGSAGGAGSVAPPFDAASAGRDAASDASAPGAGDGSDGFSACVPGDTCALIPVSPCGLGCGPIRLSDFRAINEKNAGEFRTSRPPDPCAPSACEVSFDMNVPNYVAICQQGQCAAIDIRESWLSLCTTSTDCVMRAGTGCCPTCNNQELVAFNRDAGLLQATCPGGPGSCGNAGCTTDGAGSIPICRDGHCKVLWSSAP
jgi:hypothetical protein